LRIEALVPFNMLHHEILSYRRLALPLDRLDSARAIFDLPDDTAMPGLSPDYWRTQLPRAALQVGGTEF